MQLHASSRASARLADAGFDPESWHVVQESPGGLYGLDEGFTSIRPGVASGDGWQAYTRQLWRSWQADDDASAWLAERGVWWRPDAV
ncbi:hypothetical protein CTZ27_18925 [Streptomyces griseocarneus]|nr:hypothetical protein CTZ27_18925 [Streptomyces griseocarneus]